MNVNGTGNHGSSWHGEEARISKKGNLVVTDPTTGRETVYDKNSGRAIAHESATYTDRSVYVPAGSTARESHHGNLVVDRPSGSQDVYNRNGNQIDHQAPPQVEFYPRQHYSSNSF